MHRKYAHTHTHTHTCTPPVREAEQDVTDESNGDYTHAEAKYYVPRLLSTYALHDAREFSPRKRHARAMHVQRRWAQKQP